MKERNDSDNEAKKSDCFRYGNYEGINTRANDKGVMTMDIAEACVECGCKQFEQNEGGFESCLDCGLVKVGMVLDHRPTRSFNEDGESNEHHGRPVNEFEHESLTTEMAPAYKGGDGNTLTSKEKQKWGRLRHLDNRGRIRDGKERNLATALTELKRISSRMHLPSPVAKDAAAIYRQAVDAKLIRGRSIEGVVAASLYAACRKHNNPRTLDDIGSHSRTGRKEIGRTYRFIKKQLKLEIGLANPDDYIPRFCSELAVGFSVQRESHEILNVIGTGSMVSRGPTGIAAAAIYLAAKRQGNERTQSEVAQVAGVTEVTIRNRYKELCEILNYDPSNPSITKA